MSLSTPFRLCDNSFRSIPFRDWIGDEEVIGMCRFSSIIKNRFSFRSSVERIQDNRVVNTRFVTRVRIREIPIYVCFLINKPHMLKYAIRNSMSKDRIQLYEFQGKNADDVKRIIPEEVFESLPFVNKRNDYKSAKDFWNKITRDRNNDPTECPKYVEFVYNNRLRNEHLEQKYIKSLNHSFLEDMDTTSKEEFVRWHEVIPGIEKCRKTGKFFRIYSKYH